MPIDDVMPFATNPGLLTMKATRSSLFYVSCAEDPSDVHLLAMLADPVDLSSADPDKHVFQTKK